jgi:glycosyltransferase involved in cell wall biosynthesis
MLNAPTSIALFLSRYLGIPFSFTMHGSNIHVDPLMLKTKLILCKKAVTISEFNKMFLLRKYGKEFSNKIKVIHCGIDVNVFKSENTKKTIPSVILAVGRLLEVKGFRYLLEGCSILKKKGLAFQCQIVGDGEEREPLSEMSKSLGINDAVTFLGSQQQQRVRELLDKAAIFALPSIVADDGMREGIPVALMEAMAMELPVVSTRTVGIPELINDGEEGILVEQKDPVRLASALELLLKRPDIREKMGQKGRWKVMHEFNISHVPGLFFSIFD